MALSEKDVRGIAEYAKIALTDVELTQMTSYLNDAVQMLEPVLQYDLPDVEPTFHPIGSLSNVMGDDLREPERDLPLDVALENAGSARDGPVCPRHGPDGRHEAAASLYALYYGRNLLHIDGQ